jgi:hypothetical protein
VAGGLQQAARPAPDQVPSTGSVSRMLAMRGWGQPHINIKASRHPRAVPQNTRDEGVEDDRPGYQVYHRPGPVYLSLSLSPSQPLASFLRRIPSAALARCSPSQTHAAGGPQTPLAASRCLDSQPLSPHVHLRRPPVLRAPHFHARPSLPVAYTFSLLSSIGSYPLLSSHVHVRRQPVLRARHGPSAGPVPERRLLAAALHKVEKILIVNDPLSLRLSLPLPLSLCPPALPPPHLSAPVCPSSCLSLAAMPFTRLHLICT